MAAAAKPTRTFLADKYFPVPLGVPYQESIGRHLPNMGAGGEGFYHGLRSNRPTYFFLPEDEATQHHE
jgi:hypothetical protein